MYTNNALYQFQEKKYQDFGYITHIDALRMRIIKELAGTKKHVLDLGCGNGTLSEMLLEKENSVVGFDINSTALKQAEKKGVRVHNVNVEIDPWPIDEESMDVIIASEIIEHLLDPDLFLEKIYNKLKNDGSLIISTPNTASLGRRLLLLIGKNPELEPSFHPLRAGHVRYFVKDSLFNLLKQNRFEVERVTSEAIIFDQRQKMFSTRLARIIPTLGKTLIVKANKM